MQACENAAVGHVGRTFTNEQTCCFVKAAWGLCVLLECLWVRHLNCAVAKWLPQRKWGSVQSPKAIACNFSRPLGSVLLTDALRALGFHCWQEDCNLDQISDVMKSMMWFVFPKQEMVSSLLTHNWIIEHCLSRLFITRSCFSLCKYESHANDA